MDLEDNEAPRDYFFRLFQVVHRIEADIQRGRALPDVRIQFALLRNIFMKNIKSTHPLLAYKVERASQHLDKAGMEIIINDYVRLTGSKGLSAMIPELNNLGANVTTYVGDNTGTFHAIARPSGAAIKTEYMEREEKSAYFIARAETTI